MARHRLTIGLGVTAVLFAAITLSGCATSASTGIGVTQGAGAVEPTVGECWNLTYDHLESWADWKGGQPVNCSSPHQAYTYAVTALTGTQPKSWQTTGANPHMRPDVQDAAGKACDAAKTENLPGVTGRQVLIVPAFYVASAAAWRAGARWVRCDISIIAVGSLVESPALAVLPEFGTILNQAAEKYEYCVDAPGSNAKTGPFGTHTETFADCTAQPDWSISDSAVIPGDAATPYPGTKKLGAFSRAHCGAGEVRWAIYPTAQEWATGSRGFECWVQAQGSQA
jgi:hypothetical protein